MSAGMAIFPLVFAYGLEPEAGPGLVFVTLPIAFGEMPGGTVVGTLFFILVVFAALTSSISLLEPTVEFVEGRQGISRRQAAVGAGLVVWLLGVASALSFNAWSEVQVFGKNFFDSLAFLTSNIMLPITALLIALFAAVEWTDEALGGKGAFEALERWPLGLPPPPRLGPR